MKKIIVLLVFFNLIGFLLMAQNTTSDRIKADIATLKKLREKHDSYRDTVYIFISNKLADKTLPVDEKALWHCYMARLFQNYIQNDYYKIIDRTDFGVDNGEADIETWGFQKLVSEMIWHSFKSLENKEVLQKTDVKGYLSLMRNYEESEYARKDIDSFVVCRPTLFDCLAQEALELLKYERSLPVPIEPFNIDNADFFSPNEKFVNMKIESADTLSTQFRALQLLQELTKFHLKSGYDLALLDVTLQRFAYVMTRSNMEEADSLSFDFLLRLEKDYRGKAGYADVCYTLGNLYQYGRNGKIADVTNENRYYFREAVKWYEKAVNAAPNTVAAVNANRELVNLKAQSVSLHLVGSLIPKEKLMVYEYKNCNNLYFRVLPLSEKEVYNILKKVNYEDQKLYLKLAQASYLNEWHVAVDDCGDYRKHSADGILPALPVGEYTVIASPEPFTNEKPDGYTYISFRVSNIGVLSRKYGDDIEFMFYDLTTGEPLQNKKLEVNYNINYSKSGIKKSYSTDSKGIVKLDKLKEYHVIEYTLKNGKDSYTDKFYYNTYGNSKEPIRKTYIYTDRAIYRPGQKIYYKGIEIESAERKNVVVPDDDVALALFDANNQKVAEAHLKTNEYGSFSGTFDLPVGTLTGSYRIEVISKNQIYSSRYFSVEEYKRPQFEVAIDAPSDDYRLNDSVTVTGTVSAYSGYRLDAADVSYRVVRKAEYPYWSWWAKYPSIPQKEIAQGKVKTAEDGTFTFSFLAEEAKTNYKKALYRFVIMVDVTDINGETHSAQQIISVGAEALTLSVSVPRVIDSEENSISLPLTASNLSGVRQVVDVSYKIEFLEMPSEFMHSRSSLLATPDVVTSDSMRLKSTFPYIALNGEDECGTWKALETVAQGTLKSEDKAAVVISDLKKLKEGAYRITISATDKYGTKVSREECFFIQSSKSKRSSVFEALTLTADKTTAKPGEVVTITVGSYLKKANVYLEVLSNDTLLYSEWLVLKRGQTQCEVPVTESMRGDITVTAFVADNGFSDMKHVNINVPFSNKVIDFEWGTFRDKTQPGAEEEITLKLKGENGTKVAAELLCAMYDASLDAFTANSFSMWVDYLTFVGKKYPFYVDYPYQEWARYTKLKIPSYNYAEKMYYQLINDFLDERMYYRSRKYGAGMVYANKALKAEYDYDYAPAEMAEEVMEMPSDKAATLEVRGNKAESYNFDDAETTTAPSGEESNIEPQVRSDFAETAFFFPDLRTDAEGNVVLKFKMPETLTKWKMLGLAHTQDLKVGTFVKYIQTIKDMMVVPNMPRFLREGDTILLSAKIVNAGGSELTGNASIEFYNALDNNKIDVVSGASSASFSVKAGESSEVSFKIVVPHNVPALTYRIVAQSDKKDGVVFSDGETATLPVLSNRMLVTESLNLYVNGKQTKHFDFKPLDNYLSGLAPKTREHYNLKLELTPNPMWYAVQALPYLMQYPYDCNEQIFSKMYANSLAAHIANSSPDIKKAFEAWKNENPDELCSNLEKNEDLKYAMLEETPWVLDAQNESSQKYSIGNLFDVKRIEKENAQIVRKLEKNQNDDGSWSWFGKGYPSRFITQHIVAGSGHLSELGVDDMHNTLSGNCLKKAVKYMDNELSVSYRQLKKYNTDMSIVRPSNFEIHHFYARSFFINKYNVSKNDREAYDFFLNQMKKYWSDQTIYMQSMIALVMFRNGDKQLAKTIVSKLKDRALYSEEMGMYWKNEGTGWFWYEAPVERQSMLIEAFLTIANDTESAEKMQLWLLKQKQTQNWGTTKNTAEACYALFMKNGSKLKEIKQGEPISVSLVDTVIVVEDNSATPTVMQTIPMSGDTKIKGRGVTLAKSDAGSAWGGLYWQYFDELENIEATDKAIPLSMVKQLYKVELGDRGEVLMPITQKNTLRVGDKIRVRVELRADRDFEYVHLKDMRASAFEPVDVFSGYRRQGNLYYYESVRDASVNFFFDYLRKGTYVFEYTLVVTQSGTFSNGISTVQCMYAPQFSAHSKGIRLSVEK
ncbi:MAG: hypothetical protein J6W84_03890 [Bacteroidales bacterium]|nr:hypothetical protein [Bacteroidales bacterium]